MIIVVEYLAREIKDRTNHNVRISVAPSNSRTKE